jgi:hypothetical protein
LDSDLELIDELNDSFHKLGATAVVFPPVILIDQLAT